MTFYVSQRVVCVDDTKHQQSIHKQPLKDVPESEWVVVGTIYTVRRVRWVAENKFWIGHEQLLLNEFYRADANAPECEQGFAAFRFRPVVETDISLFTAMLNPVPKRESVDA